MAFARISQSLPPEIDCLNIPVAFGRRLIPQLNERMGSDDLGTRQKALCVLGDYAHSAEYTYEAINTGIIDTLSKLLKDRDSYVKYKAADILVSFASHSIGKSAIINKEVVVELSKLLDDEVDAVRFAATHALAVVAETITGAEAIVNFEIMELLMEKLEEERKEIKYQIMCCLVLCFRVAPERALDSDIMDILFGLLFDTELRLVEKAANLILELCVCLKGKQLAVHLEGLVKRLIDMLDSSDPGVSAAAASALCSIAIITDGRYACLENNAIPKLVRLVDSEFSDINLYATKCLTLLAEAPEGKAELQRIDFGRDWNKILDPNVITLDSLPNKRAKHIAKKVIYKVI